jgi:integrase
VNAPLFKEQAEKWLATGTNRKREPWREATIATYRSQLANILPVIGELPVTEVGNKTLADVANALVEKGLEPSTVNHAIDRAKQVHDSYQDAEGQRIHPIDWNNEVIDAPVVDRKKQKTPCANLKAVEEAIQKASPEIGALIALLAGTGLRIKEALAITTKGEEGNAWLPAASIIVVTGQRIGAPDEQEVFGPTKTEAGIREIDLAPELNSFLQRLVVDNPLGLLFPKSEAYYRKALNELLPGHGFHSLRRARVTFIRLNGVPQPLVDFWTGHGAGTMSEVYTKVGTQIESRRAFAVSVGLGFKLES